MAKTRSGIDMTTDELKQVLTELRTQLKADKSPWWAVFIKDIGMPSAVLLAIMAGIFFFGRYLLTDIAKPMSETHIKAVDSLTNSYGSLSDALVENTDEQKKTTGVLEKLLGEQQKTTVEQQKTTGILQDIDRETKKQTSLLEGIDQTTKDTNKKVKMP
jgi:hypothetical protein